MAEEQGGGGLSGTVNLPGIGPTKKKLVIGVAGAAAAFVLWRYWQSSRASAAAVAGDSDGDGYADAGTLPSVAGAVSPDNSYGRGDAAPASTDSYGFSGTTNSQWTQYAATQLSAASDKWSYGDVVEALGAFVNNRPLTTAQQAIVQAAIGLAGNPPEGTHPIIPGGDTTITVAPTGVKTTGATTTSVSLAWAAVAGAAGYQISRSGTSAVTAVTGTSGTVDGLQSNTTYSFQVAAVTASGQVGPKSSPVSGKTLPVVLKAPTGVRIGSVTATSAVVSWGRVDGAGQYHIYLNGQLRGSADGSAGSPTWYRVTGLSKRTTYTVTVRADTNNQAQGPASAPVKFTTKAK